MNSKRFISFIFLFSVIALVFWGFYQVQISRKEDTKEPITLYMGISVAQMDLDELIKDSELIVIGRVDEVYPGRWSTPNGKSPSRDAALDFIIITDVNFQIEQVLKGKIIETNIRVREFGGQAGQDALIISAGEHYDLGQNYVLFLIEDTGLTADIEPGHFISLGGAQGVYKIESDRATPFHGSADQSLSIEELIRYIEAAIK